MHINKIFSALETLKKAGYVDAYNILEGRQLQIVLSNKVDLLDEIPEAPEWPTIWITVKTLISDNS